MSDPGRALFESLGGFSDLQQLISNGETEGPHLECKSPGIPQLNRGLKLQLAEAASGFANSGGGLVIWGMGTTRHTATGLDILTQIEPIGDCRNFAKQVDLSIPTVAYPSVKTAPSKVLLESTEVTRGVVITYIPPTGGDPVQSLLDREFYFRNGDHFDKMPYEILKRMFMGTSGPDLYPRFDASLVKLATDGSWEIPIILGNLSSAAAENTQLTVQVVNPDACESVRCERLDDQSGINPGFRIFMTDHSMPIYRGKEYLAGTLKVFMKKTDPGQPILKLLIELFSSGMRARRWYASLKQEDQGFSIEDLQDEYLY